MDKKMTTGKSSVTKKRIGFILLGVVALLVLFLCIGVLRRVVYGIFGYAIYAYLPALVTASVFLFIGKTPNLSVKRTIIYVLLFFMAVITLHIGLAKDIIESSSYIPSTYANNTVGGVFIGLFAGLFRLICAGNYGIMLAVTFVITAGLGLIALYPFILEMGKGKSNKKDKKPLINNQEKTVSNNSFNLIKENDVERKQQDGYFSDNGYDGVINLSGDRGELFSQLTSESDRYRNKADRSANILFGNNDDFQRSYGDNDSQATPKYNTLNSLGMDKGYNNFITNQERMRAVEENLRALPPQEEYNARFGGDLQDGYATNRSSSFDPMRQYGGFQSYNENKVTDKPISNYEKVNNVAGDMYLKPNVEENEYYNSVNINVKDENKIAPEQNIFNDRNKALDFINTPLSGEELVNIDYDRPKRDDSLDNAYMFDDSYGKKEEINVVDERSYEIEQNDVQEKFSPVTANETKVEFEKPIEQEPVVEYKPKVQEKSQIQQTILSVQEKFNIPKQPKQEYKSNVMAKEKAPVFPEEKKEEKKPYVPKPYKVPSYDILRNYTESSSDFPSDYQIIKEKIDQTMQEFDVPAEVFDAKRGPAFTMYSLKVGQGYKLSKIESVKDNLKMRLCVKNLRIHAPIAGQNALGIELPNSERDTVGLKSILCSAAFNKDSKGLKIAMGKTLEGDPFIADITKMPHLLVAGSTGTGKSVFLNAVLTSLLFKYSPDDLRLVLIDPKKVELTVYRNLPNLLIKEPVKEAKHAVNALRWLCAEMDRRYDFFSKVGCANIDQYNENYRKNDEPKMYRILLVVDEMADLMINSKDTNVEDYIVRLAQLARACGIHMIIATQRPTVKVITGLIKSNIIHRVAFTVKSNIDSRVILDDTGAEELLGLGDMLYSNSDGLFRIQGAFIDNPEIKAVCDYIRENNDCDYDDTIAKAVSYEPPKPETPEERSAAREEERDAEFEKQLQVILKSFIRTGRASVSSAQASHHVGYIKAKKLVDAMTERKFIGPEDGSKPREILITMEEWEALFGENANSSSQMEIEDDE